MSHYHAPQGQCLIAVGDIHGHLDLLNDLLGQISNRPDHAGRGGQDHLIFLGDYVDRGPNSAQVIDRLCQVQQDAPNAVFLKGNHEEMMVSFLQAGDLTKGYHWLRNGGDATSESYGVRPPDDLEDTNALLEFRSELAAVVPDAHWQFLDALQVSHRAGDYIFVHAGLRPGIPFADQRDEDMIWIRDRFLQSDADFGGCVVHGHSPSPTPDIHPNRIGLDTGSGKGGYLTAGLFWSTEGTFLHAYPDRIRHQ